MLEGPWHALANQKTLKCGSPECPKTEVNKAKKIVINPLQLLAIDKKNIKDQTNSNGVY